MQSFVTGQLSVEFDFHPGTPARLVGAKTEYPELPTIPSDMAKLKATITRVAEKVSALPLEEIIAEVTRTVSSAGETMDEVRGMVKRLDSKLDPITENLVETVAEARSMMKLARARLEMKEGEIFYTANQAAADASTLLRNVDSHVEPLVTDAQQALQAATSALGEIEVALADLRKLANDVDRQVEPLSADARAALQSAAAALDEAQAALQDVRVLAGHVDDQIEPISAGAQETLRAATAGLNDARAAVQDTRGLIADLDAQVEPISTAAQGTLQETQAAMTEARGLIGNLDSRIEPLSTGAQATLQAATAALDEATNTASPSCSTR